MSVTRAALVRRLAASNAIRQALAGDVAWRDDYRRFITTRNDCFRSSGASIFG